MAPTSALRSFDHFVGKQQKRLGDGESERLRGRVLTTRLNLSAARLGCRSACPAKNLVDVIAGTPEQVREVPVRRTSGPPATTYSRNAFMVGNFWLTAKVLIRTRCVVRKDRCKRKAHRLRP